jgi:hypothetical protein
MVRGRKKNPHPELVEGRIAFIQRRSLRTTVSDANLLPRGGISILRPSTSSG